MKLASYKGTRSGAYGVLNRVGRLLDAGPHSHTEIVFSDGVSASSAPGEGVRFKRIAYSTPNAWDFINLPSALERSTRQWYVEHEGQDYDNAGNVRFCLGFIPHSPFKWFCSESAAAALGIPEPHRYGPSGLAILCEYHFGLGRSDTPWTNSVRLQGNMNESYHN
jgi:hypothetical protein